MKVLIDRNIEINAITHKTMLATQVLSWEHHAGTIEVAQRTYFPPREDERFRLIQLPWLATLCDFARQGTLAFFTSQELRMEKIRQKGRYAGCLGINLLRDISVKSVRCPVQRSILFAPTGSIGITKEEQTKFFRSIQHPRFLQIRRATGDAHIDDAFHVWTAEEARLDVFLTMDQRFWRVANREKEVINSAIHVMTPKELGEHLNAKPTHIEAG